MLLQLPDVLGLDVPDHELNDGLGDHQVLGLAADAVLGRCRISVQELGQVLDHLLPDRLKVQTSRSLAQRVTKDHLDLWHKRLAPAVDQRGQLNGRRSEGIPVEEVLG